MKQRFAVLFVVICAGVLCSQPGWQERVGKQPDGSFLLSNGWRLKPAGTQIPLDTLPMSSALSKDGKFLLVLNGGYKPPSISVLTADSPHEISRVPVADAWLGLTFSPDGSKVYVGGGSKATVFEFTFSSAGELKPAREMIVAPADKRTYEDFIGDVTVSPDGAKIYASDMYHDTIVVLDARSGAVEQRFKTGRRPYRILFHPDGKSFFVSSWTDGAVYQHDVKTGTESSRLRLGPHTTDMTLSDKSPDGADKELKYRLFVAAANSNSVFVVGLDDTKKMTQIESINVAMTARQPLGMTPSAVTLSPDQKLLYVACSDANVLAVADISEARSRVIGFRPDRVVSNGVTRSR